MGDTFLSPTKIMKGMKINPNTYEATVDSSTSEWVLSDFDLECIALGSGLLGSGGGGSTRFGKLMAQRRLQEGRKLRIISVEEYVKKADPELERICAVALMGPTSALVDKKSITQITTAFETLEYLLNAGGIDEEYTELISDGCEILRNDEIISCNLPSATNILSRIPQRPIKITGLVPVEVGGLNSLVPLLLASEKNVPVLDCDGMGRAFPEIQMFLPYILGGNPFPASLVDEAGMRKGVLWAKSCTDLENCFRDMCGNSGLSGVAFGDLKPEEIATKTVSKSLSRAWRLGLAGLKARYNDLSPIAAILDCEKGQHLITGKIIDFKIKTASGFDRGETTVQGNGEYVGKSVKIHFQNESLLVKSINPSEVLASTPDIITCVNPETGEPIPTEEVKPGLQVSVLVLPSCSEMTSPEALSVVGPKALGYEDVIYKPIYAH